MSLRHNTLVRERDLAAGYSRDSCLKEAFFTKAAILDIASQMTCQELFCFVALLTLALLLWLFSRTQSRNDTRQTEGDNQKDTEGRSLTTRIPPGNSGWPLIGETIEFLLDGRKFFRTRRARYGSIFRSHLCGFPTIVVIGAENVQKVLTASESWLVQSPPSSFLRLFGRGALSSSVGRRHSHLQRSTLRLFTPRNLSLFVAPVQQVIRGNVARWRGAAPDDVISGSDACRQMSLSVVYQCLLGFDLEQSETSRITQLFQTFSDGVFALPVDLPGFAFHKAMVARETLRRLVSQRNSSSSSFANGRNRSHHPAMLDILQSLNIADAAAAEAGAAEDEKAASDDVADLVVELLFGANESTASAMCTILIELSQDESILERIRCELRQLGLEPGDPVDYEMLRRLTYTSDVVKEVLRVQPPIAGAFRRTCKPFPIQDYVIPAGWNVLYGITDTHEASSAFDEVQKFNPDRWKNVRVGRSSTEPDRERTLRRRTSGEDRDHRDQTTEGIQNETDKTQDEAQDEKGQAQKETGQTQDETGQTQDKTGKTKDKTGQTQDETGQSQDKTEHMQEETGQTQEETKQAQDETGQKQNKTGQTHDKTEQTHKKSGQTQDKTEKTQDETGQGQDKIGQTRDETGQTQDKTGHTQDKTGQGQDKIGQTRDETGQTQDKTGQTQDETEEPTVRSISRYEYLPFGGGGRRFCVGEALARMILSVFLIEIADGTNGWRLVNGRPQIRTAPFPFPKDKLPLLLNSAHGLRSNGTA